jgi:hypothetical protein
MQQELTAHQMGILLALRLLKWRIGPTYTSCHGVLLTDPDSRKDIFSKKYDPFNNFDQAIEILRAFGVEDNFDGPIEHEDIEFRLFDGPTVWVMDIFDHLVENNVISAEDCDKVRRYR